MNHEGHKKCFRAVLLNPALQLQRTRTHEARSSPLAFQKRSEGVNTALLGLERKQALKKRERLQESVLATFYLRRLMATITLSSSCDNLLALHRDFTVTADASTTAAASPPADRPHQAAQPSVLEPAADAIYCAETSPRAAALSKEARTPCSPASAMVSKSKLCLKGKNRIGLLTALLRRLRVLSCTPCTIFTS